MAQKIRIPDTRVEPRKLPNLDQIMFGKYFTDYYFTMPFSNGGWHDPGISLLRPFEIHPAAVVFHYGQAVFEGMKAFRQSDGGIAVFRPEMNLRRLNQSAERLGIPQIPAPLFLDAVHQLVGFEQLYVPDNPGSLYLRPAIIGTEACVKVSSADEFLFFILALPSGDYFGGSSQRGIEVLVAESVARCGPKGLGNVKAGANYAGTLQIISRARQSGCSQVLFLDACSGSVIEELGGMNIFFVRRGGDTLITPKTNGTILPGITRDSVMTLAGRLGVVVLEEDILMEDVIRGVGDGTIVEAFACGTAAVITSISAFRFEDGRRVELLSNSTAVGDRIRSNLVGIHYGTVPDPDSWMRPVTPPFPNAAKYFSGPY